MALWGGVFIIYSMVVNSYMIANRFQENNGSKIFIHLTIVSIIYLVFHYLLNIFFGRWNIDFVNNQPDLTFIAGTLRKMSPAFPHITKLFEGSSLSTIAWNLFILSWILYLLFRNKGIEKRIRNYCILGISGSVLLAVSFIRVPLYSLFTLSPESNNYFLLIVYSFIFANPYPLLPYLSYGCFGALIGLMIYNNRRDLLKKIIIPTGALFLIFGITGMMHFDKTISKPDYFWYFKTNFELGFFLLMISTTYLFFENKPYITEKLSVLKLFSRISLTIYMLETLLSEIIRLVINPLIPGWNQTINGCLLFGGFNILIWTGIVYFWKKKNFKYSLEYFLVILLRIPGKESTKMYFEK